MKNIPRAIISTILKFTLFWTAITAAIVATAGSPTTIKQSLDDSGVYDGLVSSMMDAASDGEGGQEDRPQEEILGHEVIRQSAQTALPPETLKNATEQAIDGIYRWLNGEVSVPDFQIDLTDAKARFISSAAQAAANHVAALPDCTAAQAQAIDPEADPLTLECRPPGVTAATTRQKVEQELTTSENFLKDPVISGTTLKNDEGQNVFAGASQAPDNFQRFKKTPWILILASLVLGVVVFLLGESRRDGVRRVAKTVFTTGIAITLTTLVLMFIFNWLASESGPAGRGLADNVFLDLLLPLLRSIGSAINRTVLTYGIAYVAIGGGALLALRFWWKQPATVPATSPKPKKIRAPR